MFHIFTREVLNIDKMFLRRCNTVVPLPSVTSQQNEWYKIKYE